MFAHSGGLKSHHITIFPIGPLLLSSQAFHFVPRQLHLRQEQKRFDSASDNWQGHGYY